MTTDRILWLDLETTGLDPLNEDILEIGLVVSDGLGDIIDERSFIVNPWLFEPGDLAPEVAVMHEESGLLADIGSHGVPLEAAEARAHAFLDAYFGIDWKQGITVGGSGIDRFDLPFLAEHLPELRRRFHFRTLDVSSMKELMRRHGLPIPPVSTAHRAVADATWALEVARRGIALMQGAVA